MTTNNTPTNKADNFGTSAPKKKRRQGQRLTAAQRTAAQDLFLHAFAISANLSASARHAGIDREMVRYWQEHDEDFGFRYHQAEAESNDVVRGEIFRRAVQGVDEPLHYQGRIVQREVIGKDGKKRLVDATVKKYSDTLLIFLAKARMPEFRDKQQVELSGQLDITGLAAEADARFSAYLAAATPASVLGRPDGETEG